MAWNRPSEDKAKVRDEQRNAHLEGLAAGAIVVLGAAVVAWWLWPTGVFIAAIRGRGYALTSE